MTMRPWRLATALWLAATGAAVQAADARGPARPMPAARTAAADCDDPRDARCLARRRLEEEQREAVRSSEGTREAINGAGQVVPCTGTVSAGVCGNSSNPGTVSLTPLVIRRFDLSAGIDHPLSDGWVWSGLVGVGRARSERTRSVVGGVLPSVRATTLRTRATTLASTLTWFATRDVAVDGTLSYQHSAYDFERNDSGPRRFIGTNAGHAWGLSLNVARSFQRATTLWIPQVGLDWVSTTIEPLDASIPNPPPGSIDNFTVGEQRSRTLAAQLGLQVQWPRSTGFGLWAPYLRSGWRGRLSHHSEPVAIRGDPTLTSIPPDTDTGRRAGTLAAGALLLWPGGTSLFADIAATRSTGRVRETRLSLGVKFER